MASEKFKILIVDDSLTFRNFWAEALKNESDLVVVGTANDGQAAIELSRSLSPDLIVIDLEMPVLDGLKAIPVLLQNNRKIKILVASALTTVGSSRAIEALTIGAMDYLPKPSHIKGQDVLQSSRDELIFKIRALLKPKVHKTDTQNVVSIRRPQNNLSNISAIAIGCSTGGPNALDVLFRNWPHHLHQPIFITQHMPKFFLTALAQRIARETKRPCIEPKDGEVIKDGHIYLAPGDFHLQVKKSGPVQSIELSDAPAENYCRPAVDPMFRSLAEIYRSELLAIVLTGMGEDGLKGAKEIIRNGGQVIAQDENSSVVWGMPGAITKAGLASQVLPLDQIAPWVSQISNREKSARG